MSFWFYIMVCEFELGMCKGVVEVFLIFVEMFNNFMVGRVYFYGYICICYNWYSVCVICCNINRYIFFCNIFWYLLLGISWVFG